MINLRKLFGMPSQAQEALIKADIAVILDRCSKIAYVENQEQKDNKNARDGQCPKCKDKTIVDKIRQVQGKGNVGGNLFGVNGSLSIDTDEVNHCNKCGNEWKKFKIKTIGRTDILTVALNYLGEIRKDPERNKKMSWKMETIQVFDGCCAEAIDSLCFDNRHKIHSNIGYELKLFRLRKIYKSVYDGENSRKLQKI